MSKSHLLTISDPNNATYRMETAEGFFRFLAESTSEEMPIRHRYRLLKEVYYHAVEQCLMDCRINFVGLFAKTDYIMKEYHVPAPVARLIHDTRKILFPERKHGLHLTEEELERSFPHDLKAVSLLVKYISNVSEIPERLTKAFPFADRSTRWEKYETNVVRVITESWDDHTIIATREEDGKEMHICYDATNKYLTRNGVGDWSYLAKILRKYSQLNLVRVRMEGDVCFPELIIFEPDYLINISTIASCFETYAESPYVSLINRLRPQASTMPIHLGNIAGMYLDDTVHGRKVGFSEGMNEYFHSNALNMVADPDFQDRTKVEQLYHDARSQKAIIESLIGNDLPRAIGGYDKEAVVLEPSFFSEVLGIQGRLDFLYEDKRKCIIIEQKSGKAGFVPFNSPDYNPDVPEIQEKHWVQLLLYRALFVYEFERRADEVQHIMLLYSKYRKGLVAMAQSPDLFLRAIRQRNLLTWCEMDFAEGGYTRLNSITPESLNMKHLNGKLWDVYIKPQLSAVLEPLRKASLLERTYYYRFMRFVQVEQMLAKTGNKLKENSGFASIWHDSLEEKRQAGNIYDSLTISGFGLNDTAVETLSLRFAEAQSADTSNFRIGDVVILYCYKDGEEPDACARMVNRCSIMEINAEGITVKLRNKQTDRKVFEVEKDMRWAVEHDLLDSSSSALFGAMHSFLSAAQARKDLVLCQRMPEIDASLQAKGKHYGGFTELVTRAKQARELFLIIGPPGTGKTSYGMLYQLQEELLEEGTNILITSYTNRAVDEICSKLKEQGIDFLRIGNELSCDKEYRNNLLSNRVKECRNATEVTQLLKGVRVVCATTSSLSVNVALFRIKHFDLAIVDESSQILEPHLMALFSARNGDREAIDRFVFIGDHKQLPAVAQQTAEEAAVTEPMLNEIGLTDCRLSLFERMLRRFRMENGEYDPRYVYMLTKQGRMHRDIAEFPNLEFYGGKLDIVPLEHQATELPNRSSDAQPTMRDIILHTRIAFISCPAPQLSPSDKTNLVEAEKIADAVYEIYNINKVEFDVDKTIGIIVPYRNQIATIRNAIDRKGVDILHNITIDTVERYQGSQRDYILYGFTIQRPYQLNFLTNNTFVEDGMIIDRKLNVAMTRARLHLIMFGNPSLLRQNVTFSRLLDYIEEKNALV